MVWDWSGFWRGFANNILLGIVAFTLDTWVVVNLEALQIGLFCHRVNVCVINTTQPVPYIFQVRMGSVSQVSRFRKCKAKPEYNGLVSVALPTRNETALCLARRLGTI
jgi:hypothetical protein